ncbi:MAG TPA: hypothetical protein VL334_09610 [Anaerolineae bacterium]|nr:hypothetical protein [Anaerolineae bacterium]
MHWLSFFIGVLIGWGVEWLIDYLYWRRRRDDDDEADVDLSERLDKALGALQQMRIDLYDEQISAKAEMAQLKQQLAEAQDEIAALRARLATAEDDDQGSADLQGLDLPDQPVFLDQAEDTISEELEPAAEESSIDQRLDPGPVEAS